MVHCQSEVDPVFCVENWTTQVAGSLSPPKSLLARKIHKLSKRRAASAALARLYLRGHRRHSRDSVEEPEEGERSQCG